MAAHFQGSLHLEQGDEALKRVLETQIADYEGSLEGSWTLDDTPADYIENMMSVIAGFSFAADDWKSIRKLSQNKSGERQNVVQWLEDNPQPRLRFPTGCVKRLRPLLRSSWRDLYIPALCHPDRGNNSGAH